MWRAYPPNQSQGLQRPTGQNFQRSQGQGHSQLGQGYQTQQGQGYQTQQGQVFQTQQGQGYHTQQGQGYHTQQGQRYATPQGQRFPSPQDKIYPSAQAESYRPIGQSGHGMDTRPIPAGQRGHQMGQGQISRAVGPAGFSQTSGPSQGQDYPVGQGQGQGSGLNQLSPSFFNMLSQALKTVNSSESGKRIQPEEYTTDAKRPRYDTNENPYSMNNTTWNCNKCKTLNFEGRTDCVKCSSVKEGLPLDSYYTAPPNSELRMGLPMNKKRKLFVGGLLPITATSDMFKYFSKWGAMDQVHVVTDDAGISKCYGFVNYIQPESAEACLAECPHFIHKKEINVNFANSRHDNKKEKVFLPPVEKCEEVIAPRIQNEDKITIYVSNLAPGTTKEQLFCHFVKWGNIAHYCIKWPDNEYRRCGFVRYTDNRDAHKCLAVEHVLNNKRLAVRISHATANAAIQDDTELDSGYQDISKQEANMFGKRQLIVLGMKLHTTADHLLHYFTRWGSVEDYWVDDAVGTKQKKGFVRFSTEKEALDAMSTLHVIDGQKVLVMLDTAFAMGTNHQTPSNPQKAESPAKVTIPGLDLVGGSLQPESNLSSQPKYSCKVSGCSFKGAISQFDHHWLEKHEAKVLFLICAYCSMGCVDRAALVEHLNFFHGVENKSEMARLLIDVETEYKDNLQYIIPGHITKNTCIMREGEKLILPTLKTEPRRENQELGEGIRKCHEYGCKFTGSMEEYLNHWNKEHLNDLMFLRCPLCPQTFQKMASLEFHVNHQHNKPDVNEERGTQRIPTISGNRDKAKPSKVPTQVPDKPLPVQRSPYPPASTAYPPVSAYQAATTAYPSTRTTHSVYGMVNPPAITQPPLNPPALQAYVQPPQYANTAPPVSQYPTPIPPRMPSHQPVSMPYPAPYPPRLPNYLAPPCQQAPPYDPQPQPMVYSAPPQLFGQSHPHHLGHRDVPATSSSVVPVRRDQRKRSYSPEPRKSSQREQSSSKEKEKEDKTNEVKTSRKSKEDEKPGNPDLLKSLKKGALIAERPDWPRELKDSCPLPTMKKVRAERRQPKKGPIIRCPVMVIPPFKMRDTQSTETFLKWSEIMMRRLEKANIKARKKLIAQLESADEESDTEQSTEDDNEESKSVKYDENADKESNMKKEDHLLLEEMKRKAEELADKMLDVYKECPVIKHNMIKKKHAKAKGKLDVKYSKKGPFIKETNPEKREFSKVMQRALGMAKNLSKKARKGDLELTSKTMQWTKQRLLSLKKENMLRQLGMFKELREFQTKFQTSPVVEPNVDSHLEDVSSEEDDLEDDHQDEVKDHVTVLVDGTEDANEEFSLAYIDAGGVHVIEDGYVMGKDGPEKREDDLGKRKGDMEQSDVYPEKPKMTWGQGVAHELKEEKMRSHQKGNRFERKYVGEHQRGNPLHGGRKDRGVWQQDRCVFKEDEARVPPTQRNQSENQHNPERNTNDHSFRSKHEGRFFDHGDQFREKQQENRYGSFSDRDEEDSQKREDILHVREDRNMRREEPAYRNDVFDDNRSGSDHRREHVRPRRDAWEPKTEVQFHERHEIERDHFQKDFDEDREAHERWLAGDEEFIVQDEYEDDEMYPEEEEYIEVDRYSREHDDEVISNQRGLEQRKPERHVERYNPQMDNVQHEERIVQIVHNDVDDAYEGGNERLVQIFDVSEESGYDKEIVGDRQQLGRNDKNFSKAGRGRFQGYAKGHLKRNFRALKSFDKRKTQATFSTKRGVKRVSASGKVKSKPVSGAHKKNKPVSQGSSWSLSIDKSSSKDQSGVKREQSSRLTTNSVTSSWTESIDQMSHEKGKSNENGHPKDSLKVDTLKRPVSSSWTESIDNNETEKKERVQSKSTKSATNSLGSSSWAESIEKKSTEKYVSKEKVQPKSSPQTNKMPRSHQDSISSWSDSIEKEHPVKKTSGQTKHSLQSTSTSKVHQNISSWSESIDKTLKEEKKGIQIEKPETTSGSNRHPRNFAESIDKAEHSTEKMVKERLKPKEFAKSSGTKNISNSSSWTETIDRTEKVSKNINTKDEHKSYQNTASLSSSWAEVVEKSSEQHPDHKSKEVVKSKPKVTTKKTNVSSSWSDFITKDSTEMSEQKSVENVRRETPSQANSKSKSHGSSSWAESIEKTEMPETKSAVSNKKSEVPPTDTSKKNTEISETKSAVLNKKSAVQPSKTSKKNTEISSRGVSQSNAKPRGHQGSSSWAESIEKSSANQENSKKDRVAVKGKAGPNASSSWSESIEKMPTKNVKNQADDKRKHGDKIKIPPKSNTSTSKHHVSSSWGESFEKLSQQENDRGSRQKVKLTSRNHPGSVGERSRSTDSNPKGQHGSAKREPAVCASWGESIESLSKDREPKKTVISDKSRLKGKSLKGQVSSWNPDAQDSNNRSASKKDTPEGANDEEFDMDVDMSDFVVMDTA